VVMSLVFPGQGAQAPRMLEGVRRSEQFRVRYRAVCGGAGCDVAAAVGGGGADVLRRNLVSSLLTVLVSSLSLDLFLERTGLLPQFVAGYSVGQWSALYAARMISYEQLIDVVAMRARLMNDCVARQSGGMCAVIGVGEGALESLLNEIRTGGDLVFIGNYNCPGQYSITGTERGLELAQERIASLRPKKMVRLPVSGAWHCEILTGAEREFADFLKTVEFQPRSVPVIDNVTGEWLPHEADRLRASLARQISCPVRWERGVRTLISAGCTRFTEIGYGNTLTKFGPFIDRKVSFGAFYE